MLESWNLINYGKYSVLSIEIEYEKVKNKGKNKWHTNFAEKDSGVSWESGWKVLSDYSFSQKHIVEKTAKDNTH